MIQFPVVCQSCSRIHLKGPLSFDRVPDGHKAGQLYVEGRLPVDVIETLKLEKLVAPLMTRGLKNDALRATRDTLCKGLLTLTENWLTQPINEQSSEARSNQEYRALSSIQRDLRTRQMRKPNKIVILGPALEAFCLKEDLRVLKASVVELAFLAQHSPYTEAKNALDNLFAGFS